MKRPAAQEPPRRRRSDGDGVRRIAAVKRNLTEKPPAECRTGKTEESQCSVTVVTCDLKVVTLRRQDKNGGI